jgi:hypothetical protein
LKRIILAFLLVAFATCCFGQEVDSLKQRSLLLKKQKMKDPYIIIGDKKFKRLNNWVNGGIGTCTKLSYGKNSIPLGIGYNFHIKESYFKVGYFRSELSGAFGSLTGDYLSALHACYGFRAENARYNFAYFVGVSKSKGLKTDTTSFSTIGVYSEIQLVKKIVYDVGIGLTPFIDFNPEYPIVGIRVDLFFSNAFRGRVND